MEEKGGGGLFWVGWLKNAHLIHMYLEERNLKEKPKMPVAPTTPSKYIFAIAWLGLENARLRDLETFHSLTAWKGRI